MNVSARELSRLAKGLDPSQCIHTGKLAVLGYRSTQFLTTFIRQAALLRNMRLEIYEAGYQQVEQEILNPASGLYAFAPRQVLIVLSQRQVAALYAGMAPADRHLLAASLLEKFRSLFLHLRAHSDADLLIANLPATPDGVFGHAANQIPVAFQHQIRKLNVGLMDLAVENPGIQVLDVAALVSLHGLRQVEDRSMLLNAHIPFSRDFEALLATELVGMISALAGRMNKCLITDLDNTIWGGVVGDDGVDGLVLGGSATGKAFQELQQWMKELTERGILLAVCSKNEESVAKQPFQIHPDMVLKLEDVAVFVANWQNKADNLRHIHQVLNIGFDSMVFLDDNPAERALIRSELPEVTVLELPEDPAEVLPFLIAENLFEPGALSAEDAGRTRHMQQEASRRTLKDNLTDMETYLRELRMKADAGPFQENQIARLAQLSQRSNQFNLRTVRCTEADIRAWMADPACLHLSVTLSDAFGDYGLISMLMTREVEPGVMFIHNWIMSCRAMQRGVEFFLMNELVAAASRRDIRVIRAEYLPTAKNKPVEHLLRDCGFQLQGAGVWELEVQAFQALKHWIEGPQ